MTTNETELNPVHLADGWCIVDPKGGVWWPDEEHRIQLDAMPDTDAMREIVRIEREVPGAGRWRS